MLRPILAPFVIPLPALAELPMSAHDLDAYPTGKTITWDYGGGLRGQEQYLPGRQVLWAFEADKRLRGTWFEDSGNICFVYENDGGPQCWRFARDGKRLRAQFMNEPGGRVINEIGQSPDPLRCTGPEVGV